MKAKLLRKIRKKYSVRWNKHTRRWNVKHIDSGLLHRWVSLRNALIFSVHDCQGASVSDDWFWKWIHTTKIKLK